MIKVEIKKLTLIKERNMNICLTPNMKENLDFFFCQNWYR